MDADKPRPIPIGHQENLFWRRLGATVVDLFACLLLPFFLIALVIPVIPEWVAVYWPAALAATVLGYVALGTAYGGTPGMLVTGVRTGRVSSTHRPGMVRGIGRGLIALIGAASGIVLVMYGFSDQPTDGYTTLDVSFFAVAVALFALSILGRLWMLVDHSHRTVFDRLLGLVVSVPSGELSRKTSPDQRFAN